MTRSVRQSTAQRRAAKRSSRRKALLALLAFVVVALPVGLVVYAKVSASPHQGTARPPQASTPATTPTTTSGSASSSSVKPSVAPPDESKMRQELASFVAKYYHEGWQDTTQSRTDAVNGLGITITQQARDSMDFTVYTNSVADQMRINNRQDVDGSIGPKDITVQARQLGGTRLFVSVPVTVTVKSELSGKVETRPPFTLGTVWVWQPATNPQNPWVMTAFGESGKST